MNDYYSRVAQLSPEQRLQLAQKLNERFAPTPDSEAAVPMVAVDKRLVAYVVCDQAEEDTVTQLRDFVREKLPDYMMPSAFVLLDTLPLTPNGKVDRQALPEPEQAGLDNEFVAPRTDAEEALAEIWAEILGLDEVGVYDNFFELGGHSLLVTQTISRIREGFEIELPLRVLFEAPTVAELAIIVEEALITELEALPEMPAEAVDRK